MLSLLLCLAQAAAAQVPVMPEGAPAPGAALTFAGFLSTWEKVPGGIPVPLSADEPIQLTLTPPARPGEAASARAVRQLGDITARIELFAVCPHGAPTPGGACSGLYFSFQVELGGRVGASCASSLNFADAYPFPVLVCGGPAASGRTAGLTAHRRPLRAP